MTLLRGSWVAFVVSLLSRVILTILASLLIIALVPAAFGGTPTVVMSGSMSPRLHVGDVTISAGHFRPTSFHIGQVLLVDDPDHQGRLRMHRVARINADGTLVLRGDANAVTDSTPIRPDAVRGVAVLRIPLIGTPRVWWKANRRVEVVGCGLVVIALVLGAFAFRATDDHTYVTSKGRRGRGGHRRRMAPFTRRINAGTSTMVAIVVLVSLLPAGRSAMAAFSSQARNDANSWSSAPFFTCRAAVLADNPTLFYQLDEPTGILVNDSSPNHRDGGYIGNVTHGVPGPCGRDGSTGVALDGSTAYIAANGQLVNPVVFTVEIWFKTTSTTGGKLIGFGNQQTGASRDYDRHLYISNTGQVYFGIYNNAIVSIATSNSYNDGLWHLADGALSGSGMALYLDGALVATAPNTTPQYYTGYWRMGYDNLGNWLAGVTGFFTGSLDNAAVYPTALKPAQVSAHFEAAK